MILHVIYFIVQGFTIITYETFLRMSVIFGFMAVLPSVLSLIVSALHGTSQGTHVNLFFTDAFLTTDSEGSGFYLSH